MTLPPYPTYKPSGVDWLDDVPEHWEVKRGRFCINVNPRSSRLRSLQPNDEVSFVPMEAVGEYGGLQLEQTRAVGDAGDGYTEFDDGDVVVAKITPCFENGKGALAAGLLNGAAFGTTELHVLRSEESLERRFLFYFTISQLFRSSGEGEMYGAGGQKRIPPEFCENVRILLPPTDDQHAITDFLDRETAKIDTLVAKKRTLIERLKEKRTALISRTVTRGLPPGAARQAGLDPYPKLKPSGIDSLGKVPEHWEVAQLRRRCTILDCMHRTVSFVDDGIPLASIREVHGFEVDLSDAKQTTEEEYQSLLEGDRRPRIGNIIFSRNATVGDAAIVATSARFAMGQDVCLIRADAQYPKYVLYMLRSEPLAQQLDSFIVGATFRRINVGQIRTFWSCWPPVDEQLVATDYLDRETAILDAMVTKVETAIDRLQEYRTALITAAVTGKIDVRGAVAHQEDAA